MLEQQSRLRALFQSMATRILERKALRPRGCWDADLDVPETVGTFVCEQPDAVLKQVAASTSRGLDSLLREAGLTNRADRTAAQLLVRNVCDRRVGHEQGPVVVPCTPDQNSSYHISSLANSFWDNPSAQNTYVAGLAAVCSVFVGFHVWLAATRPSATTTPAAKQEDEEEDNEA